MGHDGCLGCKYENEPETSERCAGCTQNAIDRYTPPTNADRIRSMSDEELAGFLYGVVNSACFGEGLFPYHPCPAEITNATGLEEVIRVCKKCGLDWLRQPAKEATNE